MPLKVCKETAVGIRDQVKEVFTVLPSVPPNIAAHLKEQAELDAIIHKEWDPKYRWGSGPAKERQG